MGLPVFNKPTTVSMGEALRGVIGGIAAVEASIAELVNAESVKLDTSIELAESITTPSNANDYLVEIDNAASELIFGLGEMECAMCCMLNAFFWSYDSLR